jgi:hypothetical protein
MCYTDFVVGREPNGSLDLSDAGPAVKLGRASKHQTRWGQKGQFLKTSETRFPHRSEEREPMLADIFPMLHRWIVELTTLMLLAIECYVIVRNKIQRCKQENENRDSK